jgi:hypothetical protein
MRAEKVEGRVLDQSSGVTHKVMQFISTTLSFFKCYSTIFGEFLILVPNNCKPNLIVAFKTCDMLMHEILL